MANDSHGAQRARRRQFRPGVAHSAGDPSRGALRQRLGLCPRIFRPAPLAAISGLRDRRRLCDDLALRVHRLRAVYFRRSAACADRQRGRLSGAACLRALAWQPSREPIDRALFPYAICGRLERRQRCGGRYAPRPPDRRPGDFGWDHSNDVLVQRWGGRRGARCACPGDQRQPSRYRNGFRTLWLGPDGCRRGAGRACWLGRRSRARLRPRAAWRRRLSGWRETGARRGSGWRAKLPRQRRRHSGVKRRVWRVGRGSQSGERLPGSEAREAEALSPPSWS